MSIHLLTYCCLRENTDKWKKQMVRGFKNPNTMYMAIECIVCDIDAQLCIIERKKT